MPQPTCQNFYSGVYSTDETQTIFLATRQELLEQINRFSSRTKKKRTGHHKGASGKQRSIRYKS